MKGSGLADYWHLRSFYQMVFDGDTYGSASSFLFSICEVLDHRTSDIPGEWGYKQGAAGTRPEEDWSFLTLELATYRLVVLIRFGHRLNRLLRRYGM